MRSEEHTLFLRSVRCGKSPQLREQALNTGSTKAGLAKICFHGDSVPWFVARGLQLFSQQLFSFGAGEGSLSPRFLTTSARDRRGSESPRPTTRPYYTSLGRGAGRKQRASRESLWGEWELRASRESSRSGCERKASHESSGRAREPDGNIKLAALRRLVCADFSLLLIPGVTFSTLHPLHYILSLS